jgi:hypothetical protein
VYYRILDGTGGNAELVEQLRREERFQFGVFWKNIFIARMRWRVICVYYGIIYGTVHSVQALFS